MAKVKYKAWGKFNGQTVKESKSNKRQLIVREGFNNVSVNKNEVDSLIIALLELRNSK